MLNADLAIWFMGIEVLWVDGDAQGVDWGASLTCSMPEGGLLGKLTLGGTNSFTGDSDPLLHFAGALGYAFGGSLGPNLRVGVDLLSNDDAVILFLPISLGLLYRSESGLPGASIDLGAGPLLHVSDMPDGVDTSGWVVKIGGSFGIGL